MRVPTVEQQSVLPANPYNATRPNLQQPDYRLAQTIGDVGKEVGQLGQSIGGVMAEDARVKAEDARVKAEENKRALAAAEAAKKEARAALRAEALVELQRKVDDDAAGLYATEGFGAVRESGPTLDKFDKHLKDIGERFNEPEDRLLFENEGNAALLSRRKAVNEFTTKQNLEGKKKVLEGMRAEAIRGASSVDLSPEEMKAAIGPVDATYDRILPPEAAAAAKVELRADMSEALIQRRIQSGDVEGAKTILAGDESILGPTRTKALRNRLEGAEKDLTAKSVALEVNALADKVRDEDTIVTGDALRDAMPKLAEDDPRREAFEVALEKQSAIEDKRLQAKLKVERNNADNAYGDGVKVPAETERFLRKHDRKYLNGLEHDRLARAKSARVEREGNARDKADARRRQADIDKEAEERFAKELLTNPNANHKDFVRDFIADVSKREGESVTVSPYYRAKLDRDGAEAVKGAQTKEGAAKRTFAAGVDADIGPLTKTKKGSKQDEVLTKDYAGYAALRYQAEMEKNGKMLTTEQENALKAEIIGKALDPKKRVQPAPKPIGPEYRPSAAVKVRFPNGQTFDVSPEKLDAAMKKGGVVLE